jgi:very-short-patch-repair endonuclease
MVREVRHFARLQRRVPTSAEDALWQELRGRKLHGLKFKRQEPIGPYTVDFLCFERKLIVEVDGAQHLEARAYDAARTKEIERMGFSVIRFTNVQVMNELDVVLGVIGEAVAGASALTPGPSPKRAGEA